MKKSTRVLIALLVAASYRLEAQVSSDRLLRALDEPQNWLTYSGGYMSQRYSALRQLDASNVKNLELKWTVQNQVFGPWESSPLVVDGTMYLTERPNDVMAIDAKFLDRIEKLYPGRDFKMAPDPWHNHGTSTVTHGRGSVPRPRSPRRSWCCLSRVWQSRCRSTTR